MRLPARAGTASAAARDGGWLVAWVALIAADRIDVFGHAGGVFVPPFLLLTPVVVAIEILRRRRARRPLELPGQAAPLVALAFVLLSMVLASVLVSPETTVSAGRAVLLCAYLSGAFAVVLVTSDRPDLRAILGRGAVIGILLYTLFDVAELGALLGRLPKTLHLGPTAVLLMPSTYGEYVPRLSGMVTDQNRSGFVLLFFGWCVAAAGHPRRRGYLALVALLMVLTLSRSGAVAALATTAVLVAERRAGTVPRSLLLAVGVVISVITLQLLASERAREVASDVVEPLVQRVSVDEGSSKVHFTLIGRGLDEATESVGRLALGLGYGSAYTVLDDLFPGDRYGNFHSLYVTMLAESGLLALASILVMLTIPLLVRGPYRALVAGAAVFNIFYQTVNDPAFWAVLMLAWIALPPFRRVARAPVRAPSASAE